MDTQIELRHLRYFVAVAEELHFGRAAERLGIAQPPLSQQIRRLEALVGTPLFHRTSRHVSLTQAGAVLLEGARRTLAQVADSVEGAQRAGRGETGAVTVAFASSVMFQALPTIIREFRAKHPAVHLELRELSTGAQMAALHGEEIDIGFMRQPGRDKTLHIETIMTEPLVIAVSAQHPLAQQKTIDVAELADEEFVLFPSEVAPGLHDQIFALCREAGFTPNVTQESREPYTTVSLVEAGVGVTIVPASVHRVVGPAVVYRPIASPLAQSRIGMAWRLDDRRAVTRAFVRIVRDVVGRQNA